MPRGTVLLSSFLSTPAKHIAFVATHPAGHTRSPHAAIDAAIDAHVDSSTHAFAPLLLPAPCVRHPSPATKLAGALRPLPTVGNTMFDAAPSWRRLAASQPYFGGVAGARRRMPAAMHGCTGSDSHVRSLAAAAGIAVRRPWRAIAEHRYPYTTRGRASSLDVYACWAVIMRAAGTPLA